MLVPALLITVKKKIDTGIGDGKTNMANASQCQNESVRRHHHWRLGAKLNISNRCCHMNTDIFSLCGSGVRNTHQAAGLLRLTRWVKI